MIISINTKEDSKNEILRVINLLQSLINENPSSNQGFSFGPADDNDNALSKSPNSELVSKGIFNLFKNDAPTNSTADVSSDSTSPDSDEDSAPERLEVYEC